LRRAALYGRSPLRQGRRPDRALRRRSAHDRGGERPPRRRTPAARRPLQGDGGDRADAHGADGRVGPVPTVRTFANLKKSAAHAILLACSIIINLLAFRRSCNAEMFERGPFAEYLSVSSST